MKTRIALTAALALAACEDAAPPADQPANLGQTGVALTAAMPAEDAVAQVRYLIAAVACPDGDPPPDDARWTVEQPLIPGSLPAGVVAAAQVDPNSAHVFADHFQVLPPGCYDVAAVPLDDAGQPSDVCSAADARGVVVEEGQTTEIALYSQCDGVDNGALDLIAIFNHAPTITAQTFSPSKFAPECAPVEICATAVDRDGDPVEFEWAQIDGPALPGAFVVSRGPVATDDGWQECVQVNVRAEEGYRLEVRTYDLMNAATNTRFEGNHGIAESHATLRFPLYGIEGECEGGPMANGDADGDGVSDAVDLCANTVGAADASGCGPAQAIDPQWIEVEVAGCDGMTYRVDGAAIREVEGGFEAPGAQLVLGDGHHLPLEGTRVIFFTEGDEVTGIDMEIVLPWIDYGLLDGLLPWRPVLARAGLARGVDIKESLDAPLADDRCYLYFQHDSQPAASIGPIGIKIDPKQAVAQDATYAIDPTDPAVFMTGSITPAGPLGGDVVDNLAIGLSLQGLLEMEIDEDAVQEVFDAMRAHERLLDPDAEDGDIDFRAAQRVAIIFGEDGPVDPDDLVADTAVNGQLYLRGDVPIPGAPIPMTIVGEVILGMNPGVGGVRLADLDTFGGQIVGNGSLRIGTGPLFGGLIAASIEVAEASHGIHIRTDGSPSTAWFTGRAGVDLGFLPDFLEPWYQAAEVRISGGMSTDIERSFVHLAAEVDNQNPLGLPSFPLMPALESKVEALISSAGVLLTVDGDLGFGPMTGVATNVEVRVPAEDPALWTAHGEGTAQLLGLEFAEMTLDMSAAGVEMTGRLETPIFDVEVAGSVTEAGVDLRGSMDIELCNFPGDFLDWTVGKLCDAVVGWVLDGRLLAGDLTLTWAAGEAELSAALTWRVCEDEAAIEALRAGDEMAGCGDAIEARIDSVSPFRWCVAVPDLGALGDCE